MANEALYSELAKALSRPSKAYRATQAALDVPNEALQGYLQGSDIADKLQERKLNNQTLFQALGGQLPKGTEGYGNLTVKQFKPTAELLTGLGSIEKSAPQYENVMTQEDALKAGKVPKGTKIVSPSGDTKTYIGNDSKGNPLLLDKTGNITIGQSPSGPVLPKSSTMPTASTRSSSEFAQTLLPHIDRMRDLINQADAKGYIGPASGRIYNQFLSGAVGSTGNPDADNLLGELRATDSLIKTGAMRVHFGARGGGQMYDHFSDLLNSGKQSSAMLNGSLNGIQNFMEGYAQAGNPNYIPKQKPVTSENNDFGKAETGLIRIRASDGSIHDIPQENIGKAKQIDPGAQVVQ